MSDEELVTIVPTSDDPEEVERARLATIFWNGELKRPEVRAELVMDALAEEMRRNTWSPEEIRVLSGRLVTCEKCLALTDASEAHVCP